MSEGGERAVTAKVGRRFDIVFYATAVLVLALDQLTKWAVRETLPLGASRPLVHRVLSLTHQNNTGAAFGLFPNWTVGLIILAVVVVIVLFAYGPRAAFQSRMLCVGLALQLGGAAGNLHDRVRLGHVTDFIDFHFWPVFNIADAAITCGAVIIAYSLIASKSEPQSAPAHS